ncbi:MAG: hypothetical protein HY221_02465 [Candidatus Sungbacteria bacterium]|uniref:Uncharacterized protein n=1 Tax=Candidatus Sungiibacteriota bacterium TaxID=2750080 RepID=A0A932R214_9BACT|nr:hypothetical protein [Candidatus Sungbacteria bacterium]
MTRKRWYFYSLSLPFAVPLLLIALSKLPRSFPHLGGRIDAWAFVGMLQLVAGIVPYLIFVALVLYWARNKSASQIAAASWAMPLWFWAICTAAFFITPLSRHHYLLLGLFALPFGYFYVATAHTLTWLFIKLRWVKK